jgi:hypothetical protein
MIFVVDFDGTCVLDNFPDCGQDVPNAEKVLKLLTKKGHLIILFTCRCDSYRNVLAHESGCGKPIQRGQYLSIAIKWFKDRDIPLWGINTNPEATFPDASPKPFAQMYIDDKAFGCPLIEIDGKKVVDWKNVYRYMKQQKII